MAVGRVLSCFCLAASAAAGLPDALPTVTIRGVDSKDHVKLPMFGLGTWQYNSSRAEHAVDVAFGMGYRHVDTAQVYGNQRGIGAALQRTNLQREEFFVTSKIPGGLNLSATIAALDGCLQDLRLSYVDLMLIHFPSDFSGKGGPSARREEWLALEAWAKTGKARAIGVSHYCQRQAEDIMKISTVPIAVNQVQYHVGMGAAPNAATDDKAFFESKGILYQSFSPLCGPCNPPDNLELINGSLVTSIGAAHNKTGSQVALRWLVQQGIPVIPKSDNPMHLKENMELFDFTLTEDEMKRLSAATKPAVGGGPSASDSGDCSVEQELQI